MSKGFTLIELLIVVLIIGVLTSVAVPQYEMAVEKTRAAEAVVNIRALAQALELYYMANGSYPPLEGGEYADGALEGLDINVLPSKNFSLHTFFHNYIMYKRVNSSRFNYRISQTLKNTVNEPARNRGLTCDIPGAASDTPSARLCKSLCGVSVLTQVWGSGEQGCAIK